MAFGLGGQDWLGFGQGGAAREAAMANEYCGRKPGIFASRRRKNNYEYCIRESLKLIRDNVQAETSAQKALANAQLQSLQFQQRLMMQNDGKKDSSLPIIIGVTLGAAGLITLIIVLSKSK